MKVYAVIDTNVIVSALMSRHPDSATVLVMEYISKGDIIPILNDEILHEYYTVLNREKFKFPKSLIESTINDMALIGVHSERISSGVELLDPKDTVFYEISLSVDSSYLVTGNIKHFPNEPFVVTPAEMVHIMRAVNEAPLGLLNNPKGMYINSHNSRG